MWQQNDFDYDRPCDELPVDQIVSIDFGSFGFAASFCPIGAPSHQRVVQDWSDSRASAELNKNLAALLIDKETKQTVAMGYEAEVLYSRAQEKKEDDKYMYFEHFKPYLYRTAHLEKNIPVTAADGESTLPLTDLITKSLEAVMQHSLSYINGLNKTAGIDEISNTQIFWVISVPAIWDEMSKEMMKCCARKAGMKYFELGSEPIVSTFYVLNTQGRDFRLSTNDKILLLDCGGCTIDASCIQIKSSQFDLSELHHGDGVMAGGIDVDKEFIKLLNGLLPNDIIGPIKDSQQAQWVRQKQEFVLAKFSCPLNLDDEWNVPFCYAINALLAKKRKKQKKDPAYKNIKSHIEKYEVINYMSSNNIDDADKIIEDDELPEKQEKVAGSFKLGRSNLKINKNGWLYLHESVFRKIIKFVNELFSHAKVASCDKVIVVGGFANSNYLISRLLKEFPNKKFFTPRQPHLSVVKGALYWICQRRMLRKTRAKYSYGIGIDRMFNPIYDVVSRRKMLYDSGAIVENAFSALVTRNEEYEDGYREEFDYYIPSGATHVEIFLYASEDQFCRYIFEEDGRTLPTEDGRRCFAVKKFSISLDKANKERQRFTVTMEYRQNGINCAFIDPYDGKMKTVEIDTSAKPGTETIDMMERDMNVNYNKENNFISTLEESEVSQTADVLIERSPEQDAIIDPSKCKQDSLKEYQQETETINPIRLHQINNINEATMTAEPDQAQTGPQDPNPSPTSTISASDTSEVSQVSDATIDKSINISKNKEVSLTKYKDQTKIVNEIAIDEKQPLIQEETSAPHSKLDDDTNIAILHQLMAFGYQEHDIVSAIVQVKEEKNIIDINNILDKINKMHCTQISGKNNANDEILDAKHANKTHKTDNINDEYVIIPKNVKHSESKQSQSGTHAIQTVQMQRSPTIVWQGYMSKKGGWFNTSYKKRWFQLLSNKQLSYFSHSGGPMNGTADLTEIDKMEKKGKHEFEIITPKRDWLFLCQSTIDRDNWFSIIKNLCMDLQPQHMVVASIQHQHQRKLQFKYGPDQIYATTTTKRTTFDKIKTIVKKTVKAILAIFNVTDDAIDDGFDVILYNIGTMDKYVGFKAHILIMCISGYDHPYPQLPDNKTNKHNFIDFWQNKTRQKYQISYNKQDRMEYADFVDLCINKTRPVLTKRKHEGVIIIYSGHSDSQNLISSDGKMIKRSTVNNWFSNDKTAFIEYVIIHDFEYDLEEKNEENDELMSESEEAKHDINDDYAIEECVISKALVLIICISRYNAPWSNLPGTKIDKNNMIDLWDKHYGYDVVYNQNDTVNQSDCFLLLNECRNMLSMKQNQNKYQGVFVIFSCHGTDQSLVCSDGKTINRSRLIRWFNGENVPFMSNKPKIIIMDACRGGSIAFPIPNNNKKNTKKVFKGGPNDDAHHPDEQITLLYSTTDGYAVPDDEKFGGNVIRTIYDVFSNDANIDRYHLDDLFKITQSNVKKLCDGFQCIEQRNLGNATHIYLNKS